MDKSKKTPLSPVYSSFEELAKFNKTIFGYLKTAPSGLLKAVWESRNSEVETLKERLKKAEAFIKKAQDKFYQVHLENQTLQELFNDQIDQRKAIGHKNTQLKKYVKNLESIQEMKEKELEKLQKSNSALNNKLELSHQALLRIDFEYQELKVKHHTLEEDFYQLEAKYKEMKSKNNHFRRLNQQMEQELLRSLDASSHPQ